MSVAGMDVQYTDVTVAHDTRKQPWERLKRVYRVTKGVGSTNERRKRRY